MDEIGGNAMTGFFVGFNIRSPNNKDIEPCSYQQKKVLLALLVLLHLVLLVVLLVVLLAGPHYILEKRKLRGF